MSNNENRNEYWREYKKKQYKAIKLLIRKDDTEVLDKLANVKSKNGYIIDLIKKDIKGGG